MSLRTPLGTDEGRPHEAAAVGSLFGPPLRTPFWDTMAVSPPRSPNTLSASPPTGAATCFSRLQIDDFSIGDAMRVEHTREERVKPLSSAIHTWGVSEEEMHAAAYVYFEESTGEVVASNTQKGIRLSKGAVLPKPVFADAVCWLPLLTETGERGYAFALKLHGETQATIEAFSSRIVVAHASYSPLSVESGLTSPSTRLVFEQQHVDQLTDVVSNVASDEELGYLPNGELLVGRGMDRLVLRRRRGTSASADDDEAHRVWAACKTRLRSLNSLVVRGIEIQNQREFLLAEIPPKEILLPNLAVFFA